MKRSTFITWDQLKVGTLVLVGMVVIAFAVYNLGKAAHLFSKRYPLVAYVPNANGLRVGASVLVAGQLAGTVKAIDFLPPDMDTTRNLRITMDIDQQLQDQIREDSKARIRTQGLLGDKVMDINAGTPRTSKLEPGDTIALAQSLDYEQVINQASGAVGDLVQLTADMKEITGGIVRGEGTMGQLVMDRSLYDHLVAVLGATDSLLMAVNDRNGTIGKMLHDSTMYANLSSMAKGGDSLMTMLTKGNGTANKLLTDQQLYDQLNKMVTDLNAILADVRRDPGKYMKGVVKVF
jgi:phospholipid/cholesterol/gamma-HCH transport system substrate-binding protein